MGTKAVKTQFKGQSGELSKGTYGGDKSGPVGHERVPASVQKLGLHGGHTLSKSEGRMHMKHVSGGEQESESEEKGDSPAEEKGEGY